MECQELSVDCKSDDGSLPSDSYIRKWCDTQEEACQKANMTLIITGEAIKKQMEDAGFENVTVREFKIPVGSWPADQKMKEMGNFQLVAMLEGIHGLTVGFWVNLLGWSVEEVIHCPSHYWSINLVAIRFRFQRSKADSPIKIGGSDPRESKERMEEFQDPLLLACVSSPC